MAARPFKPATLIFIWCLVSTVFVALSRLLVLGAVKLVFYFFPALRPLSMVEVFQADDALVLRTLQRDPPLQLTKKLQTTPLIAADEELAAPVQWKVLGDGNVGVVYRCQIALKKKGVSSSSSSSSSSSATRTLSVVFKCAALTPKSIFVQSNVPLVEHEHKTYSVLSKTAAAKFMPEVFFMHYQEFPFAGWFFSVPSMLLVTEDYGHLRYVKSTDGFGPKDAVIAARTMARFHASTYNSDLKHLSDSGLWWAGRARTVDYCAPVIFERVQCGIMSPTMSQCKNVRAAMDALCDFETFDHVKRVMVGFGVLDSSFKPPLKHACCTHTDFRCDNMFLPATAADGDEARMIDWQVAQVRHPLAEWGMFLVELAAQERDSIQELLEVYTSECKKNKMDITTEECVELMPYVMSNAVFYYTVLGVAVQEEGQLKTLAELSFQRLDRLLGIFGFVKRSDIDAKKTQ